MTCNICVSESTIESSRISHGYRTEDRRQIPFRRWNGPRKFFFFSLFFAVSKNKELNPPLREIMGILPFFFSLRYHAISTRSAVSNSGTSCGILRPSAHSMPMRYYFVYKYVHGSVNWCSPATGGGDRETRNLPYCLLNVAERTLLMSRDQTSYHNKSWDRLGRRLQGIDVGFNFCSAADKCRTVCWGPSFLRQLKACGKSTPLLLYENAGWHTFGT